MREQRYARIYLRAPGKMVLEAADPPQTQLYPQLPGYNHFLKILHLSDSAIQGLWPAGNTLNCKSPLPCGPKEALEGFIKV